MGDFAQAIDRLDREAVRPGEDGGGLHGAPEGGGEDGGDFFSAEALGKALDLFPAIIGESYIRGAGEAIFRGEDGGAVTDEEDASVIGHK
jgi:hypothetical protein